MKRQDVPEAATLAKELERLERYRWVIANLSEVTFQVAKASDYGPNSHNQGDIPPTWWTLRMQIELASEDWKPVKTALVNVYDRAIGRTKDQMRDLGVDPEDDL